MGAFTRSCSGSLRRAARRSGMKAFQLTSRSVLQLIQGDLTQWTSPQGAIVNAANERMLGGGGVDGAIHRRAGRVLRELCGKVPEVRPDVRCPTGEARLTSGKTGLPVEHVIHTVGPVCSGAST